MSSTRVRRAVPADRVTRVKTKEEMVTERVMRTTAKVMRVARGYRRSDILMRNVNHDGSVTRITVADVLAVCDAVLVKAE
jgi:hypothetical protein